jgi:hypothetical protein
MILTAGMLLSEGDKAFPASENRDYHHNQYRPHLDHILSARAVDVLTSNLMSHLEGSIDQAPEVGYWEDICLTT